MSEISSLDGASLSTDFTYATELTDNTCSTVNSWSTSCCASEIAEKLYGLRYSRGKFRYLSWLLGFVALIFSIYGNFHCSFSSKASGELLIGIWSTSHPGEACFAFSDSAYIDKYLIIARIGSVLAITFGSIGLSFLWFSIFLTLQMIRLTYLMLFAASIWYVF